MRPQELFDILGIAEKLKCNTRHSYTSSGRHESVAEHSWRISLMAMLLTGEAEYRDVDMNRVIRMCLIHDLGEAFTGDIPTFEKKETDERTEEQILNEWVATLPETVKTEFSELLSEMKELKTTEARLYKALDKLEAVIQHNEADISTWLPLEYDLQLTYGREQVAFSPFLREVKAALDQWTREKIGDRSEGGPEIKEKEEN